jgi:hypothetical protein
MRGTIGPGCAAEHEGRNRTWLCDEPHGELVLEHDDRCSEGGTVRQQLERERRRDLVWDVGHANIEVWQLCLHYVCLDDLRMCTTCYVMQPPASLLKSRDALCS